MAAQSTTTLIESVIPDELYKDRFEFKIPSQDFKHVNYTAMDTSDYSKILHKSPSDKFVNSLKLKHFGIKNYLLKISGNLKITYQQLFLMVWLSI